MNNKDEKITNFGLENYEEMPVIRLCYVAFEKFNEYGSGDLDTKVGQTYDISSPFKLPKGMTIEDSCKVVSYLSDEIEFQNDLEPACEKSVILVSNVLEDYGFEKIENKTKGHYHTSSIYSPFHKLGTTLPACEEIEGVVDLFTVGGDLKLFEKSKLSERYIDWYFEGVTKQDVDNIYDNIKEKHQSSDFKDLEK